MESQDKSVQTERVVDAPSGGRLLDICDAAGIDLPFACRAGACGTCLVSVIRGRGHLAEPSSQEYANLRHLDHEDGRLACLVEVVPGPGTVELVLPIAEPKG